MPALRLHAITKRFGALVANDGISLDVERGEVLALLGENGAGKSTLVSILFGHYLADSGTIEVDGKPLPPGRPRAALAAGIGIVHQHFLLADNLSVLDNVMLGTESLWRPSSRRGAARERLLAEARRFGLRVDPEALVGSLSVGERQRVEILRALVRGARVLILDEPTAVLTPQESEALFATLASMVAQGLSIVFISHKLDEVLRVSDRIAVLRAGRLVAVLPAAGADKATLATWMVGRRVGPPQRGAANATDAAATTLPPRLRLHGARLQRERKATGWRARAAAQGPAADTATTPWPPLDDVSFDVHAGEIVAIAGVSGNGQAALAEVLWGERRLDAGRAEIDGRPLPADPRGMVAAGVARIPEDRAHVGLVADMALWENAVLERYRDRAFAHRGVLLRRAAAVAHARGIVERYDVRGAARDGDATRPDLTAPARRLSGGNMQKLILGRALTPPVGDRVQAPRLIVAQQPTWGLDVGAVAFVHQRLLDAAAAGSAVLLISEDLDEVFALADRIAVMHHGRLTPPRPTADWTLASIGLAMAGAGPAPASSPVLASIGAAAVNTITTAAAARAPAPNREAGGGAEKRPAP